MGQRSQMYVIAKKEGKYYMTANYYQWNYGERMISRTRGVLEQIVDDFLGHDGYLTYDNLKLRRIMDVNWDMHDIVLSCDIEKEFDDDYEECWKTEGNSYAADYFDFCFTGQDNNDGQMYIYIDLDSNEKNINLGFSEYTYDEKKQLKTADQYLDWNCDGNISNWLSYMSNSEHYDAETIEYTKNNIEYINNNSKYLSTNKLFSVLTELCEQKQKEYEDKKKGEIV